MRRTVNNTLSYRVRQVEKRVETIDTKIDKIMENHLPHLQQEILSLKTRVNVLVSVNMFALIVAILVSKLL